MNTSATGFRAIHYISNASVNLSNVNTTTLAIKRNLKGRIMMFKVASEKPWENRTDCKFHYDDENWQFNEFNLSEPNPEIVKGKFDPAEVSFLP